MWCSLRQAWRVFARSSCPTAPTQLNQSARSIIADEAGAVYVSGISEGQATIDGVTIPFTDWTDGWLVKLQPDGALDWTSAFTGTGRDWPTALALDSAGRVAAADLPEELNISVAPLGQGRYALAAGYVGSLTPGEFPEFPLNGFVAVLDQNFEIHGMTEVDRSNKHATLYDVTGSSENSLWAAGSFELRLALDDVSSPPRMEMTP